MSTNGFRQPDALGGAELAVLAARFEGIASKMGNTLLRTGDRAY